MFAKKKPPHKKPREVTAPIEQFCHGTHCIVFIPGTKLKLAALGFFKKREKIQVYFPPCLPVLGVPLEVNCKQNKLEL